MGARLAFVDDPARLPELPAGYDLVALVPAVELAAELLCRPYLRPEDHAGWPEIEEDGAATFELLERACDALDRQLVQASAGWPGSTHWHFWDLKTLVDGLRSRWLAAERLVAATGADDALLLLREGSLALDLLAAGLPALGVGVRTVASAAEPPATASEATSRLRSLLAGFASRARRRRRDGSPLVACVDAGYGVPEIAAALRVRGADFRLFVPRPAPRRMLGVTVDSSTCAEARALFRVGDTDIFAAAAPRLQVILERDVPRSAAMFVAARAEIDRLRPDVLLGSTYAAPRAKSVAAAARAAGVPVVVSRHGEAGMRRARLGAYQDLDAVDVALCWGAWEAAFTDRYAPQAVARVVVGSPSMEAETSRAAPRGAIRSRLGFGDEEIVVLYLPTNLNGEQWVANRNAPSDSDFVRHQRRVVSAMVATEGLTRVVKAHPTRDEVVLEAWRRAAGPTPLRVLHEPGFAELVHLPDAVLLDFPSTTLVQALRGSARIYVLDHPVMAWEPGVREHLAAHGVVFVTADALGDRLRADLDAGLLGPPVAYPQAALEPLAASGAGTAAERAADAVIRIASGDAATTISAG